MDGSNDFTVPFGNSTSTDDTCFDQANTGQAQFTGDHSLAGEDIIAVNVV